MSRHMWEGFARWVEHGVIPTLVVTAAIISLAVVLCMAIYGGGEP